MDGSQQQQASTVASCNTDSFTVLDWTEVFCKADLLEAILRRLTSADARNVRQLSSGARDAFDRQRARLAITDRAISESHLQSDSFSLEAVKGVAEMVKRGCNPRELSLQLTCGSLSARRQTV
jgi:hypothetical protein